MLNRIIAWALRQRLLVVALAVGVALVGTYSATQLPKDVLPDLGRPRVSIMTEAHGYVAEDVEQLVTRPLEQAVAGTTGVVALRSTSSPGLSVVQIDFDWGSDLYRSRQLVQEKMASASRELPEGLVPMLAPISSLMGQVHMIGVRSRSGETETAEIRDLVDRDIRLRLLAIPGVAQVVTTGGAPRQLQVTVKADLLRAHDVTLMDVAESIREANRNASGGLLPIGTQAPFVTATGFIKSPEDLASAVVRADQPRSVLLSDVAEVDFGPAAIRVGEAGVDGNPGVIMVVLKQPGTDTLTLTARVDAELANISKTLAPDLEILPDLFRQSDFIERAVDNVVEAVWLGGLLVVLVLVVFLLNIRTTIITLTAIPLSIAVTAIVFHAFDVAINTMTLGGLAVAIGALVDDAIVDVENVLRRLRQNRKSATPRAADAVVFLASSEVRGPILVGTLVVAAVYLPLFALTGMEGRLFRPVGVAYIVSIVASLVVALTVTPALCAWLLPRASALDRGDGLLVRGLKRGGQKLILLSTKHPIIICQLLGVLVLFSLGALSLRGTEFLPTFNEGTAQIDLILPADTSLKTSDAYGRKLEQVVSAIPGVNRVGRRTGRAEGDEHVMGVGITEMIVTFKEDSGRTREEVLGDIRAGMDEAFPGVPNAVEQPLGHLLSHLLSGVNAQVAIKIRGHDLPTLRRFGDRIKQRVGTIPGVTDLLVEQQVLVDRVEIAPRRGDLARLGVRAGDLAETVELALEGEVVSRFLEGRMAWPIIVRLAPDDRKNLEDLRSLVVAHGDAEPVTLADVADVRMSLTPNQVKHEDTGRRLVVSHNVEGRPLGDVVAEVRRELDVVRKELPTGYTIDVGGQFQAQEAAGRLIFMLSFVSLAIMFLTLFLHFRSVNLAIQVLLNIPAAFIGAAWLVIALDQTLSIATLVGLVSLGGIASRNGILLIDHYLHLMREEGMPFGPATVIQAGRERLVPVLMTALTSGIALVPLLVAGHAPGRELLYPVATVIVGGLFSTTLLDLLLTPGVFLLFGRKAAERHVARGEVSDEERDQLADMLEKQALIAESL